MALGETVSRHLTRGFLFADLRGYTAYVEAHGDEASARLLDAYRQIVREIVGRFGGAEIRTEGDSFYVVFSSASEAIRCGLAISADAARASAERPEQPIAVGIGIHAGETVETAEGYVGSVVNIAARICAQAAAGEVFVSDTVRSLTRTSGEFAFTPRGRKRLKGIAEPVVVFAVSTEAPGAPTRATSARTGRAQPRILVAGGFVALAVVLALGGTFALTRSSAPASSPPPSIGPDSSEPAAITSPIRAAYATSSPALGAFPTAAEDKLLQTLPPIVRATCVRGRNQDDLAAAGFSGTNVGPKPLYATPVLPPPAQASVACRPAAGATSAWFLWYDLAGVERFSWADIATANIGARFNVDEGDCARPAARGVWHSSLGASGLVVCLKDSGPDAHPWIYWTFGSDRVLGVATAPIGGYPDLYAWWQQLTPFLN